MANNVLEPAPPPALPFPGNEYERLTFQETNNILRLFFNRLTNAVNKLVGVHGSRFLECPCAAYYDTTSQNAAANTVTQVTFNTVGFSTGFTAASNRLTAVYPGVYCVSYNIQTGNTGAAIDDITVWFRKNGTDIAYSAVTVTVPAKHGAINGAIAAAGTFVVTLQAGDYLELFWHNVAGTAFLYTYPAGVGPTHPAAPCVYATVELLSAV